MTDPETERVPWWEAKGRRLASRPTVPISDVRFTTGWLESPEVCSGDWLTVAKDGTVEVLREGPAPDAPDPLVERVANCMVMLAGESGTTDPDVWIEARCDAEEVLRFLGWEPGRVPVWLTQGDRDTLASRWRGDGLVGRVGDAARAARGDQP